MTFDRPGTAVLLAGADIAPVVEPTDQFAELIVPTLRTADIRFGQCERSYSTRGWPPGWGRNSTGEGHGDYTRLHPRLASIWKTTEIDVASLASNHTRDFGPDALVDTLDLFREMGIATIGAGRNIDEARMPAILERNGVRVAFLGYVSVMREGEQAAADRPGLTPLRARTSYEQTDYQPGTPPIVHSQAIEQDVVALEEDIRRARSEADAVIVSLHWGVHWLPKVIAEYQQPVAHRAIDAGADLILGHHPHILKAVEVYRGKACFYSMGNFISTGSNRARVPTYYNVHWYEVDPDDQPPRGMYHFPKDAKKSLLVRAVCSKRGVERVSFLPVWIDSQARPAALSASDARFGEVLDYMEWVSDEYAHAFTVEGDEVLVHAGASSDNSEVRLS